MAPIKNENEEKKRKDTFAAKVDNLNRACRDLYRAVQSGNKAKVDSQLAICNKAQNEYLAKLKAEKERIARLESF